MKTKPDGGPEEIGGGPDEIEDEGLDLENTEAEDEQVDDPGEGGGAEGEADPDAEIADEPPAQGQARSVAPRGPRGQPNGQRIRDLERQVTSQKADFDRQLQQLLAERRMPSPAEQAAAAEAERQRLDMMSPAEVAQYYHQKTLTEVNQQTQQIAVRLWDQTDQSEYDRLLERNPRYRRFDDAVADLRRQAPGVARKVLLATAIGLKALEQEGAATTRATKAVKAEAERHRTTPSNGRGDVLPERNRGRDNLEERLRGQSI